MLTHQQNCCYNHFKFSVLEEVLRRKTTITEMTTAILVKAMLDKPNAHGILILYLNWQQVGLLRNIAPASLDADASCWPKIQTALDLCYTLTITWNDCNSNTKVWPTPIYNNIFLNYYGCSIQPNNNNPSTDDKASWLIYYPSESPILFNLPMKNIQDAFIEINELDYDYKVLPCLLLYENLSYH